MSVAILTCILGDFDTPVEPAEQSVPSTFHRWTDENFPPIAGLTPRLQYRIPKLFGWEMFPRYDYYVWLDGTVSLQREDSVEYFLKQLGDADMGFFHHPQRKSIKQEVDHLEDHLKRARPYITPRYKNGLHKEQYQYILDNHPEFVDDKLWATTMFIYRNTPRVQYFLKDWWYHQSRYFTCDQVPLPWLIWKHRLKVVDFDEPIYKTGYMSLVSHHK